MDPISSIKRFQHLSEIVTKQTESGPKKALLKKVGKKIMTEKYELYNGKVILEFDPVKHFYSINGKSVYGVTSVTGVLDKPALIYWAVNQAVEYLEANLQAGKALDEVQIKNLLEGARTAHRQKKDKAADIGTLIHDWVASYVKAISEKKTPPKRPVNKEMKNAIDGFFKWAKANKLQIIKSEQKIYHNKYKYAGTLDLEGLVNGKRTVIDIKTGNALYPEAFLQASAYLKAREQEMNKKYPGGVIILRLSKEDPTKHISAFEAQKDEDVNTHFKCFLYCLGIYRWKVEQKRQAAIKSLNGK